MCPTHEPDKGAWRDQAMTDMDDAKVGRMWYMEQHRTSKGGVILGSSFTSQTDNNDGEYCVQQQVPIRLHLCVPM